MPLEACVDLIELAAKSLRARSEML
jgi:hypothetical protein